MAINRLKFIRKSEIEFWEPFLMFPTIRKMNDDYGIKKRK